MLAVVLVVMGLVVAACNSDTPAPAAPEAKAPTATPVPTEPPVTLDSLTDEFCDALVDILKSPPGQWEAEAEKVGIRLGLKAVVAGRDEEVLFEQVFNDCGEELISAATGPEPTPEPEPTDTPTPAGPEGLALVEQATVQIVAQGTFIDPNTGGAVTGAGAGSGFIVSEDGLVVTNNHVVTGAATLNVFVPGRDEPVNARVVAASECSDLAVIQLPGGGYPFLEFHEGPLTIGTRIFAAGYPLGEPEYALVGGIISKLGADGETSWASVDHVLQHDAAINPGNSGGPLVTEDGDVVGVVYASRLYFNQFFAIGLDQALPVLDELMAGNSVDSIGINGEAYSGDGISGLWVFSVESGSAADEAGILPGDFIMELERLPLGDDGTMRDYCDVLQTRGSDQTMQIELLRLDTGEVLEGQLNGRPLAVTDTFGGGGGGGDETETYVYVTDDTGVISASMPAAWQLDTAPWADVASLAASPNLTAWQQKFSGGSNVADTAGIFIVVIPDSDGVTNEDLESLLDAQLSPDNCTYTERFEYDDGLYTGFWDGSDCDNGGLHIVLAAIYPADPTFLIFAESMEITGDDVDATPEFYSTFMVSP